MRDVARIQHCGFRCFTQTVVTVGQRVSQGAQHHAVVSEKGFDASDRLRKVKVEFVSRRVRCSRFNPIATAPGTDYNARHGEEWFAFLRATARARPRPPAAMRRRESFV